MITFDRGTASLFFSPAIDSFVYFHTVMDGIVSPLLLLVQIIRNQYVLKASHQTINLTHDSYPPMLRSTSEDRGWLLRHVCSPVRNKKIKQDVF